MTSYRIEIKKCPNCNTEFLITNLQSNNSFGAKLYTDFSMGPMQDAGDALLTCPSCFKHQWVADVPTLKSMSDSEFHAFDPYDFKGKPERGNYNLHIDSSIYMKSPKGFQEHHYEDALQQELWKTEAQEKLIRIRAWWSFNNDYREQATEEFNLSPEQESNLFKILPLLDQNDLVESVMKAEVLRELGQFEECLKQLDPLIDRLDRLQLICPKDFDGLRMKKEVLKELGHYKECFDYLFNGPTSLAVDTIKRLASCKMRQVCVIE